MAPRFNLIELRFLENTAELVIRARRALTYTYSLRFSLEGGLTKLSFFDFMQGDLEASLEKLNKRNEEDWLTYIDTDSSNRMHLGENFFKFKQEVNSLSDAVERHFTHIINQIEAGLPGIVDDEE